MDSIQTWEINNFMIKELIEEINNYANIINDTRLLNKNTNEKLNILEKFVYDVSLKHLRDSNLNIDNENIYIEFWCKNKFDTNAFHVDCDEFEKLNGIYYYPLLSCVTYFNENSNPTIITNIDMETYIYKNFEYQKNLFISFPKILKQITFDGKFFHGSGIIDDINSERIILAINIWERKPTNINYYISNNTNNIFQKNGCEYTVIEKKNDIIMLNNKEKIKNYNFFNELLYNNSKSSLKFLSELITPYKLKDNFIFLINQNISYNQKKTTDYDIIKEINDMYNRTDTLNRFYQRHILTNFYAKETCKWIINESEKYANNNGGWTKKRHHNYPTTDLPVEKIKNIFDFCLESFVTLNDNIIKLYSLPSYVKLNIIDLFIVKYSSEGQNLLEMHKDGSFLTFNISLSDSDSYCGGGTLFEDGITTKLEQGDLIIHCSQINHGGIPITKGLRYLLVGFINLVSDNQS
jgi:hypothetical protein